MSLGNEEYLDEMGDDLAQEGEIRR
jgi:hypothetical protein